MNVKVAAIAGFSVLLVPGGVSAQGGANDAAAQWSAVTACAQQPDAGSRHQCIDDVLRRAGLLGEREAAPRASEAIRGEAAVAAPAAPAAAVPPRQSAPVRTTQREQADEVVTTIAGVRSIGFNKFLVTAADGSVWEQTDAEPFADEPRKGDSFTARRAALGGYRCRFEGSTLYRCRPVG